MKCFIYTITAIILFSASSGFSQQPNKNLTFQNVKNWKVGDTLIYKIEYTRLKNGNPVYTIDKGYSNRKVTYDTGDAFWLCGEAGHSSSEEMSAECNTVQQYLVRKTDGVAIKQYHGVGGVGRPRAFWLTDLSENSSIAVPYGKFDTVHIHGRHFFDYERSDFMQVEKWYAKNLPLDGLVQFVRADGPDGVLKFKLVKTISGSN